MGNTCPSAGASIWAECLEISGNPARLAAARQFIIEGLAACHLKPIIAKTFPLDEVVAAHRYLESNQQFGKIVVTV